MLGDNSPCISAHFARQSTDWSWDVCIINSFGNKSIVFLQSKVQVCSQPWSVKIYSLSEAKGRHTYCLLQNIQVSYSQRSSPAMQPTIFTSHCGN